MKMVKTQRYHRGWLVASVIARCQSQPVGTDAVDRKALPSPRLGFSTCQVEAKATTDFLRFSHCIPVKGLGKRCRGLRQLSCQQFPSHNF